MACSWNLGYEPHKVIENGTISRTSSYWPFTVTMAISCILSEIERANVQTSRYFHTPAFDGRARGLLTDYCDIILNGRTTMARLAEQTVTTMWGFVQPFDTVDKSDRRTDGHRTTSRHGMVGRHSAAAAWHVQLNSTQLTVAMCSPSPRCYIGCYSQPRVFVHTPQGGQVPRERKSISI